MDDLAAVYYLESIEQVRAIADELRQRILEPLIRQPMTVTQLGDLLGQAPARVHYHVRELERVRLVELVETREKGGILEKYYRAVARSMLVPPSLLRSAPPDEVISALGDLLQGSVQGFMQALSGALQRKDEEPLGLVGSREHFWMTPQEAMQISGQIGDILGPYRQQRDVEGAGEYTFVFIAYPTQTGVEEEGGSALESRASAPQARSRRGEKPRVQVEAGLTFGKKRRVVVAGALSYSRRELEQIVEGGETLDITSLGLFSLDEDVPPELADRAISRFRHRGMLRVTPAVGDVLKAKAR